jgi:hypothetical protein
MTLKDIARMRMYNQGIEGRNFKKPEDVVRHMGAMQAQDFNAALEAVALRMSKPNIEAVEKAINDGKIIRTWPMRRTIHFVAREDARWMLDLTMSIALQSMGPRSEKVYGLTDMVMATATAIIKKALKGGEALTRPELYEALDKGGVASRDTRKIHDKFFSPTGRGLHILVRLAHQQLICFGPRQGKNPTFVLMDEWVPKDKTLSRDDSLKELMIRYFTSHGPAQLQDFGWWSGLSMKDIKKGIELALRPAQGKPNLTMVEVEGKTYYLGSSTKLTTTKSSEAHFLPAFDEFLVSYKDRSASLEQIHAQHYNPGANGMLSPIIVIDGQVIGTWRRVKKGKTTTILSKPFKKFSPEEKKAIYFSIANYKEVAE